MGIEKILFEIFFAVIIGIIIAYKTIYHKSNTEQEQNKHTNNCNQQQKGYIKLEGNEKYQTKVFKSSELREKLNKNKTENIIENEAERNDFNKYGQILLSGNKIKITQPLQKKDNTNIQTLSKFETNSTNVQTLSKLENNSTDVQTLSKLENSILKQFSQTKSFLRLIKVEIPNSKGKNNIINKYYIEKENKHSNQLALKFISEKCLNRLVKTNYVELKLSDEKNDKVFKELMDKINIKQSNKISMLLLITDTGKKYLKNIK